MRLKKGEVLVILGPNGAGKTTIIKSIMGLLTLTDGSIIFGGEHELHKLKSFMIHRLGISWVPEGRQIWGTLSALAVYVARQIDRSPTGYAARCVRDDPVAAEAIGISVLQIRTLTFAIGTALIGMGGAIQAHYLLIINPTELSFLFL